jgi:glycosyltransferase involved in cell wall biosynthesis
MPLVSIILPCYLSSQAQGALLDETLSTVDAQTIGDYEVIVVDDGSPVAAAPIAASHPRTTTVPQPNAGPAVARNTGIARSRGRFLVFLDADDHLLPPALEVGLAGLTAEPACGFTVGGRDEMTFDGAPLPYTASPPRPGRQQAYVPLLGFEWFIMPPSSAMFRRELVDAVGGFQDPWGADDLDFYLRAALRSDAWCHRTPVTRYRRYSTSSSRDGERMLRSVRAVYDRHRPLVEEWPAARQAFAQGLAQLTEIFRDCLVENIEDRWRRGDAAGARRASALLAAESPERWARLAERFGDPGSNDARASASGRSV